MRRVPLTQKYQLSIFADDHCVIRLSNIGNKVCSVMQHFRKAVFFFPTSTSQTPSVEVFSDIERFTFPCIRSFIPSHAINKASLNEKHSKAHLEQQALNETLKPRHQNQHQNQHTQNNTPKKEIHPLPPKMSTRYNFTRRQRYIDSVLHGPRTPHVQDPNPNPNSPYSNARSTPRTNTSENTSSSSASYQRTGTHDHDHDCDADVDFNPKDPHAATWRRVNAMGGLGSAVEQMIGDVPERRARRAREEAMRGVQVCMFTSTFPVTFPFSFPLSCSFVWVALAY